jgi:hypothetical protein
VHGALDPRSGNLSTRASIVRERHDTLQELLVHVAETHRILLPWRFRDRGAR